MRPEVISCCSSTYSGSLLASNSLTSLRSFFASGDELDGWSLPRLFLASFLTLFAELAFIRWLAVEIRVFAYFKNLALLVCFLGFGMGCAMARRRPRWGMGVFGMLGVLLAIRIPLPGRERFLENLSATLGGASDMAIWNTNPSWEWRTALVAAGFSLAVLFMVVCVFIPIGQVVSRQMDLAPRTLYAYSWNLAGSLAGILAFFAVCWLMLPPAAWMGAVLLSIALLQRGRGRALAFALLILPAAWLLHDHNTPDHFVLWTPYQQIEMQKNRFSDGELKYSMISVNRTGYQVMVDLSPDFLRRHKLLDEPVDDNPYNLPFRFAPPSPSVMIVGAGSGNDTAAALRNGSRSVDAVEIDPAIWQMGIREHPERPYQSPKVTGYLTDARAFLKRTHKQYDLILFGLLDSHTQFSDYSNMRIDNFVYTREAFEEARQHLAPDGVLFVKFQLNRPWMGPRLERLLTEVFGKKPLAFMAKSSYSTGATCFVISASDRVQAALAADPRLAQFTQRNRHVSLNVERTEPTTDDWPYLYHEGRWIPRTFYSVGVLVLLLAGVLYGQIPEARRQAPSLFFFAMGAGFLLLETQTISRLALYFGTTWQVNGIVIAAVLTALLLANAVAERRSLARGGMLAGLLAGLLLAYFVPFARIPLPAAITGWIAAAVFSIPVFFAGLLFASEFRVTASPSAALGANMLGAVVGGLLENFSLVVGMRALLLMALVLYCVAGVGMRWRRAKASAAPELAPEVAGSLVGQ
jgi:spermidine synthase